MGHKEDFLSALNESLPKGVSGFLDREIPDAPEVVVDSVDSAIIASGILSKYLLDLFHAFGGLTPVELLLRIGQKNATLQAALLAGLEYFKKDNHEFSIISPTETGIYQANTEIQFSAEFENQADFDACSGMSVDLVECGQNFVLDRLDDQPAFMSNILPELPEVVEFPFEVLCRFTASFEEGDPYTQTVTIQILEP